VYYRKDCILIGDFLTMTHSYTWHILIASWFRNLRVFRQSLCFDWWAFNRTVFLQVVCIDCIIN